MMNKESFRFTDINTTPIGYNEEYEQLRQDFEMNGRTVDNDYDFEPSFSSTPKTIRRFDPSARENRVIQDPGQEFVTPRREIRPQQWNNGRNFHPNQYKNLPKKKLKPHKASLKDVRT
jgi:hypothetical protein